MAFRVSNMSLLVQSIFCEEGQNIMWFIFLSQAHRCYCRSIAEADVVFSSYVGVTLSLYKRHSKEDILEE